jgi:hypothetical protein
MFNYDPEVPAGFQDADIEQAHYEAEARESARLRREGICTHGSGLCRGHIYSNEQILRMREDHGDFPDRPTNLDPLSEGKMLCLDCGQHVEDPFP